MAGEHHADLTRPLLDAVALFETLDISYALVGGLAAMYYGRQRFTEDVDFIAAAQYEDVLAGQAAAMRRHHFDPSCTWKLYHESGAQIDIWKDRYSGDMIGRATTVVLAGQPIRVVEMHDLIAMKLRADRPQDDYDISQIIQHQSIDDNVVRSRVDDPQFQHYLAIKQRTERA